PRLVEVASIPHNDDERIADSLQVWEPHPHVENRVGWRIEVEGECRGQIFQLLRKEMLFAFSGDISGDRVYACDRGSNRRNRYDHTKYGEESLDVCCREDAAEHRDRIKQVQ